MIDPKAGLTDVDCRKHEWRFACVTYRSDERLRNPSRIYMDRFFCIHCLETVDRNERVHGDMSAVPLRGAYPA